MRGLRKECSKLPFTGFILTVGSEVWEWRGGLNEGIVGVEAFRRARSIVPMFQHLLEERFGDNGAHSTITMNVPHAAEQEGQANDGCCLPNSHPSNIGRRRGERVRKVACLYREKLRAFGSFFLFKPTSPVDSFACSQERMQHKHRTWGRRWIIAITCMLDVQEVSYAKDVGSTYTRILSSCMQWFQRAAYVNFLIFLGHSGPCRLGEVLLSH